VHPHYGFRATGCPGNMLAELPGAFKNSPVGDGRGRHGRVIPELRQPLTSTVPTAPAPSGPIEPFPPFVPAWGLFSVYPIATNKPTLRLGSHGDPVAYLQGVLKVKLGYGVIIDKNFGPQTDKAVRKFQTERGLVVDGIVGKQTWDAIDREAGL
jgi:Putative peptidoglycan binding domain